MDTNVSFEIITLLNPTTEPFDIVYNNTIFRTIPPGKAMRLPKKPFGELAEKHLIDRLCNIHNKSTSDPQARAVYREQIVLEEDVDNTDAPLDPSQFMQRKLDKLNNTNEAEAIKVCDICGTKTFSLGEHKSLNHPVESIITSKAVNSETLSSQSQVLNTNTEVSQEPKLSNGELKAEKVEVVDGVAGIPIVNDKPAPETKEQKEVADVLSSVKGGADHQVLAAQDTTADDVPQTYAKPYGEDPTREQLIAFAKTNGVHVDDPKTKEFLDTASIEDIRKQLSYDV